MGLADRFDDTGPALGQIVAVVATPAHGQQPARCGLAGQGLEPGRGVRVSLDRKLEVREHLQASVDICARHGCPLELILKDISTVNYEPQRLWRWAEIAMETVGG